MRVPNIAMVIVGLALWCGLAPSWAQAAASTRGSQGLQASPPAQSSPSAASQAQPPPSPPQYSADGLYNLANSYARAGKPGLAVLNYERASLLAPNDDDINANLDYVRASAHVPTEPRTRFAQFAQAANPTLAAWIGVLGIALVGTGLLARKIAARSQWMGTGGVVLGVASMALAVSNAALLWPRLHEAVVLVNQTPARVSP